MLSCLIIPIMYSFVNYLRLIKFILKLELPENTTRVNVVSYKTVELVVMNKRRFHRGEIHY